MKTTIRQSEPDDYKAIRTLYAQTSCYSGTLQLPYPTEAKWKKNLSEAASNIYSLVALIDNKIVGQIGMQVNTYPRRKHTANIGMAVDESFRNHGVGSLMLKEMVSLANNWLAVTRIELEVYVDNEAAIKMYKNHGFVVEGTAKSYAFRNGEYVDVLLMAKVSC
jgi:putative acetyltransferase